MTFAELTRSVFAAYDEDTLAQALDQVISAFDQFPDEHSDLFYWTACLAAATGQPDRALTALQSAADAGFYYHESALRDSDLDPIRERPQFQALAALFAARLRGAAGTGRPELCTWSPAAGVAQGPLLVLHGNGSRPALEEEEWQPAVRWGWQLAMPQSSLRMSTSRFGWLDYEHTVAEVMAHYKALGSPTGAILGGYSRGAGVAISMALTGRLPIRRFIAVAPSFRPEGIEPLLAAKFPAGLRGCIIVGDRDFAYQDAVALGAALRDRGSACETQVIPGLGHNYATDFADRLRRALDFVTAQ